MFEEIQERRRAVEENIAKSFGINVDDSIEKARSGRYKDTPENRKLGRVGQEYGGKKQIEHNDRDENGISYKKITDFPHHLNGYENVDHWENELEILKKHTVVLRYKINKAKKEGKESEEKYYEYFLNSNYKDINDVYDKISKLREKYGDEKYSKVGEKIEKVVELKFRKPKNEYEKVLMNNIKYAFVNFLGENPKLKLSDEEIDSIVDGNVEKYPKINKLKGLKKLNSEIIKLCSKN